MKLELIKEVKDTGAVFYFVEKDGRYIDDSTSYGGNIFNSTTTENERTAYERTLSFYNFVKEGIISSKKVLLSEEI